jgi:hypothetical protein
MFRGQDGFQAGEHGCCHLGGALMGAHDVQGRTGGYLIERAEALRGALIGWESSMR